MIPTVVARQTRETVLDYLRTTFALADDGLADALFAFLDSENGLFRGPYVDVRLPFRKAPRETTIPLEIAPTFTPYQHQLRAFERLTTQNGRRPRPTLVTTGTGSGKTECFLFPILDHCHRHRGEKGIKAILLYPMNALAADQARRLAETLWDDPRLKGHVTAGLFIGDAGKHGVASREHLVDDKPILRRSPPDILLTNYRMLDFLLMRPQDQGLWQHNGADTLRFLVLDELHSYDGAQGSDVACLIRRLQERLGSKGSICPVGTSATIGGQSQEASSKALLAFAQQVFGTEFPADSVVTEERQGMVEVLGNDIDDFPLPAPGPALDAKRSSTLPEWIEQQARLWIPGLPAEAVDAIDLGQRLRRHAFLRQMLRALDRQLRSYEEIDAWLCAHEEGWSKNAVAQRHQLLDSFLGLVSFARTVVEHDGKRRVEPFLTVQVQLWLRELRHLVRQVATEPRFAWDSDGTPTEGRWLPIAYCRSCGGSGWASWQRESEHVLQTDVSDIGRAWLHGDRTCRYVALGHVPNDSLFVESLHPGRLGLQAHAASETPPETLPVHIGRDCSDQTQQRFLHRCPDCDADQHAGLSLMGSRAPSLLSVAISHLFQTGYNQDKKLLAFTDSVQDASHRAGFFSARTYRFNLRTAIQGVLEQADDDVPLVAFPDRLIAWVEAAQGSLSKAVATLWPSDLRDFDEYESFLASGGSVSDELRDLLRQRLSWEVAMEYGYAARVGRTLERTLCSTVGVDVAAVRKAAEVLQLELAEGGLLEAPITIATERVQHFLGGMLQRLRVQGGVCHPLLDAFVEDQGGWFHLTKKRRPLLSPFGKDSRLPRFLTEQPPDGRTVFASIAAAPEKWTWHRDWATRALGLDRKERGVREIYRRALQRLVEGGVLHAQATRNGPRAFGLRRDGLVATKLVTALGCNVCQNEEVVPSSQAAAWVDQACLHYRCLGSLRVLPEAADSYYGRRYRSGAVERIFAQEHTGLLSRESREHVEEQFKQPTRPDAPNLLVCTPTLEMGVDIGDLSATVLCTVPPTTANYLQRIGRAGRRTGNALCVTMAIERPHDLYFQADPLQMMRGQVLPPGCFLDAPEMLKRQLVAYAMDAWARQESNRDPIAPRTAMLLGANGTAHFPDRFLTFYRERAAGLIEGFLRLFGGEIKPANQQRLRDHAGARNVEDAIRGSFDRIRDEREELRLLQRRTRDRLEKLGREPETFDNVEEDRRQLEDSERMLGRLIQELGQKYPLNVLTDAGILPNYAFPEPGVQFKAVLQGEGRDEHGKRQYTAHEYMRAASSAIRELAPWNTFYAEGHKLVVKELDLGTKANKLYAPWRLCAACHHVESVRDGAAIAPSCPRCHDPRWQDSGQLRQMLRFQRARTLDSETAAASSDESDDRDGARYQVEDLIDVGREHVEGHAKVIESLPFGIELLKGLALREINFGNQLQRSNGGDQLTVAGREVLPSGFRACIDCGRVREPNGTSIEHAPWCPGKPGGKRATRTQEHVEDVVLFREVVSEAIRVLVPAAEVDQERRLLSFRAALELGFRRRFSGNPRHLQIRMQDEPLAGEGRRRFLVVFDTVPGGTGYLSELWHQDHFRDVLDLALRALEECPCQRRDPPGDGCYQCLYAFQQQRHLGQLSNREAREMLQPIVLGWPQIVSQHTLSDVTLETRLESELEQFFWRELKKYAERNQLAWTESVRGGEVFWTLTIAGIQWEILAQADLGLRQGTMIACRPDFLLRPANGNPSILPVAVFCDGFEYHACPKKLQGRVADDVEKREALRASGAYVFWSITWKDVLEFQAGTPKVGAPTMFAGVDATKLGKLWQSLAVELPRDVAEQPAIAQLLQYLARPERHQWQLAAEACTAVWLAEHPPLAPELVRDLEEQLAHEPAVLPIEPRFVEHGGSQLARLHTWPWLQALGRLQTTALAKRALYEARLVLRLMDTAEGRSAPDFEASWRAFLHTLNLLQFHPGCRVVTSEGIALSGTTPALTALPPAPRAQVSAAAESQNPVADFTDLVTPEVLGVVRALLSRGAPPPVAGFELFLGDTVAGMAELAWPGAKVAMFLSGQTQDRDVFVQAGWHICGLDERCLAEALGLSS